MTRADATLDATLAGITLAEWRARAEAAERASAQKERLLESMSKAHTAEGRIVVAVGVDTVNPGICFQSNHGDEDATVARLLDKVGPYLKLLALIARSHKGKAAQAELDTDARAEVEELERELAGVEAERDRARLLLGNLVDNTADIAGLSEAWVAADRFVRGERSERSG